MFSLLVSLFASGVVAQQITAAPNIREAVVNNAINMFDPEYSLCSAASVYLDLCLSLNPEDTDEAATSFVECACCGSTTDFASAYYTCASYLSDEAPLLSTEISGKHG